MMVDPEVFKKSLSSYSIQDSKSWDAWLPLVEEIIVDSEHSLLRAGEDQKYFYVIKEGLVRYFYTSHQGKEWNKSFFYEGQVVGSLSAYLTQAPSRYNIQTLEPSILYRTPIDDLMSAAKDNSVVAQLIEQITQIIFLRNEVRESILLTGNAQERFDWLEQNEHWLIERKVAQYHLASYLGMDAVSLSRLKGKRAKLNK
ncbi:MAG: Crp/Fnr family transcriptional regulator [Bermanella sp.]